MAVNVSLRATDLDTIGITELRSIRPDLTGVGVSVGQIEATTYNNPNDPDGTAPYDPQFDADNYEVNPSAVFTSASNPSFTYVGKDGVPTTAFSPVLESGHADAVGGNFYGTGTGAAPGVAAIVAYNANYFFPNVVQAGAAIQTPLAPAGAPPVSVVNQSFVFTNLSSNDASAIDQLYDDYVVNTGVIFVTAAGNGGGIQVPASAFNVITVGDSDGGSSFGPTSDGRSKPDIVAPGGATSFSTPYVSGVAAVMVQAGASVAGGTGNEAAAVDARTIKALLMNGAVHPDGWSHSSTQPLDPLYGAGIVNAFNSYQNLAAGRCAPTITDNAATPVFGTTTRAEGWDLNTLTTGDATDAVAHYLLNVAGDSAFTGTLVWNRPAGTFSDTSVAITSINHFELLLYNVATDALIESISSVDDVQYLYSADLPAGVYDLEVVKLAAGAVSDTDTYALAFNAELLDPSAFTGEGQGGAAETDTPPAAAPEPASISILASVPLLFVRRRRAV